jgi:hypothetical protein
MKNAIEKRVEEFGASIGSPESSPWKRVEVWGYDIDDAERRLIEKYGRENIRGIWPVEDRRR